MLVELEIDEIRSKELLFIYRGQIIPSDDIKFGDIVGNDNDSHIIEIHMHIVDSDIILPKGITYKFDSLSVCAAKAFIDDSDASDLNTENSSDVCGECSVICSPSCCSYATPPRATTDAFLSKASPSPLKRFVDAASGMYCCYFHINLNNYGWQLI